MPTTVSPLFSLPVLATSPPTPESTPPSFLFSKDQASYGYQPNMKNDNIMIPNVMLLYSYFVTRSIVISEVSYSN